MTVIDAVCSVSSCCRLTGLVHVGDELREVNGVSVIHKRPDEISQLLVRDAVLLLVQCVKKSWYRSAM